MRTSKEATTEGHQKSSVGFREQIPEFMTSTK